MNSPFYSNQVNPFCRVNMTHRALSHSILMTIDHLPRDIVAKMFAQLHIKQIFVVPNVEMRSEKRDKIGKLMLWNFRLNPDFIEKYFSHRKLKPLSNKSHGNAERQALDMRLFFEYFALLKVKWEI